MHRINSVLFKFKCAFKGLFIAFTSDNSFKIHFAATISVIFSAILLEFSKSDWMIIILLIGLVLVAELFNTAIEFLVKLFTDDYHELAEKILDISAGAVLLSVIISIIIAVFIYLPYLL
ncbi:diacylglycerol kinase family protein [Thiospirochaeta perfilievii]|uniref:Diacylglycerol kinase family protein n=1 Tax=Thiospirochaeta perfilievii TaxID=252967 RepID=A0A5C1QJD7_9SPIO|nr:diacylglycerol kinase family protein [Thiospirochaeta perfilievii]QEN06282.1 diacylglycerol kinase family protein [Thiospirochaeta perfilievii]